MLRRAIALSVTVMAISAGPALALTAGKWNTQMKDGTATALRKQSGGCTFTRSQVDPGTLIVQCLKGASATLAYTFTSQTRIIGTPTYSVDFTTTKLLKVRTSYSLQNSNSTIRVRVVVGGGATVAVHSVSVGYYT